MNKYNLQQLLTAAMKIHADENLPAISFAGVQIPMMQRDYAQGRPEEQELRDRLLAALFGALSKKEELELDFVYGAVKERDGSPYFIPLDGQQRLTTLFLLHWYIGQRELPADELADRQAELSRFSYDTRSTARDFCLEICALDKLSFTKTPGELIRGKSWFFSAYEKDPTVKNMLYMLDAIHESYQRSASPLYPELSRLSFYVLPLDGFGLTDELYIKMNARGKPLTDFENFKADLINWMTDKENPERELFLQEVYYDQRLMPYVMAISLKLDNEWTNFFWAFTRDAKEEKDKLVDPLFLRFFNRLALNRLILTSELTQDALEKSDAYAHLYAADQRGQAIKYTGFQTYQPLLGSYVMVRKIEQILDHAAGAYSEIFSAMAPCWNPTERWHFFGPEISQTQRILFLGLCSYLEQQPFEERSFRQWMRVVWNIIINPDIRSVQAMMTAIKLMHEVGAHATAIYPYLAGAGSAGLEERYRYSELAEERQKAALIVSDADWEQALISGEQHPLFLGSVGFILLQQPAISVFGERLSLARQLFDGSGARTEFRKEHVLMRALIASITRAYDLENLKMEDSADNWALLLRRSASARRIVCGWCDTQPPAELPANLLTKAGAASSISWEDTGADQRRLRFTHQQLYQPADFHAWMQERNAVGLVRRDEHFYIKKYRAWYDMVMLDTYRNLLISSLITRYDLSTKNRCAKTSFFWGYTVDLEKTTGDHVISIHFDQHHTLGGGLARSKNVDIPEKLATGEYHEHWHWLRQFDYGSVRSEEAAGSLADEIGLSLFDTQNPASLTSLLNAAIKPAVPEETDHD